MKTYLVVFVLILAALLLAACGATDSSNPKFGDCVNSMLDADPAGVLWFISNPGGAYRMQYSTDGNWYPYGDPLPPATIIAEYPNELNQPRVNIWFTLNGTVIELLRQDVTRCEPYEQ